MNRVVSFLQHYLVTIAVLIGISILLSVTFSNFIVTSNNHKAAEMYIGELKYSMEINNESINTLTVPTGKTIVDVKVNNLNPVDTYYKLLYLKNTNITVKYYESTKDTDDVVTTYNKPNDSITSRNSNIVKLLITNSSTSSQNIAFTMKGGYITNTLEDIVVPSTYSEITNIETPSSNTYFCKTSDTLTQGLEYVNGQYTYGYKIEAVEYSSGSGLPWTNISSNGWGVQLTNKTSTDSVSSKLCTYINNKPIVSMRLMFRNSKAKNLDLSNFNTGNVTNMGGMFAESQATTLDLSGFDTSKVTNMSNMFQFSQATTLDISHFNTSKVTDMSDMFFMSQATTLDLSSFNTSKVTDMRYMFYGSKVTTLDLSSFDTSKVTDMSGMFYESQATTLDLSSFNTSKVTNMRNMFYHSNILKTIYTSDKFNTNLVTTSDNMFYDSTNLVGGSGTTYNSSYTDKTYARIDGGTSNPGYFTDIADKPSEPNSFATDSWKTIINAVKNNNIGKYNVGDTKTINMGTYGTHTLRIANTSTPSECSGTGFSQTACGFVLEFADLITTHPMNDSATNTGGWPATTMRTFVNDSIYNALPSDLRNSIMNTTVVSGIGSSDSSGSATCFKSTDKLYLLAPREIYNNYDGTYDTANSLTRTLDYYITQGVTTTNYSGAIKRGENISYNQWWWLRNANSQLNYSFSMVYDDGSFINNFGANQSIGVSPAFRIG